MKQGRPLKNPYREKSLPIKGKDIAPGSISGLHLDKHLLVQLQTYRYNNNLLKERLDKMIDRVETMDEIIRKLSRKEWGTSNPTFYNGE